MSFLTKGLTNAATKLMNAGDFIDGLPEAIKTGQAFYIELPQQSFPSISIPGMNSIRFDMQGIVWALMPWQTDHTKDPETVISLDGNKDYAVVLMPQQFDLNLLGLLFAFGLMMACLFSCVACCYSKKTREISCRKNFVVVYVVVSWMLLVGEAFNFYLRWEEGYKLNNPSDSSMWKLISRNSNGRVSTAIKTFLYTRFTESEVIGNLSNNDIHYVHWPMANVTFILFVIFALLQLAVSLCLCCGWFCLACSKRKSSGQQRREQKERMSLRGEDERDIGGGHVNNYNSTNNSVSVKV